MRRHNQHHNSSPPATDRLPDEDASPTARTAPARLPRALRWVPKKTDLASMTTAVVLLGAAAYFSHQTMAETERCEQAARIAAAAATEAQDDVAPVFATKAAC